MSDLHRWQARYAEPGYLFGTEPNAFLRNEAHRLPAGSKVLALADGEGRNGVFLAEQGHEVHAVEFSPHAIAKSAALARQRAVSLHTEEADLAAWEFPTARYDAVVAIFIQFAAPALRTKIFDGIKQALKPGGILLLQGYRPKQLELAGGDESDLAHYYTGEILVRAFYDFAAMQITEHDSVIQEGNGHAGLSALIDVVGRK